MTDEDDIQLSRLVRSVSPPASGNNMTATSGSITTSSLTSDAVIDDDTKVRRKWAPGYPWSSDYYFGGGES